MDTYYEVLGLARAATPEDIRAAYRRLALQTHPDKHPDDPEAPGRFQRVSEAYQVLSDPSRRAAYDCGETGVDGSFQPPEDLFRTFFQTMLDSGFFAMDDSTIDGLFEGPEVRIAFTTFTSLPQGGRIYQGLQSAAQGTRMEPVLHRIQDALGRSPGSRRRTRDIRLRIHIDLEEAYQQKLKKVTLRRIRRQPDGGYAEEEKTLIFPLTAPRVVFRQAADQLPDHGAAGDVVVDLEDKPHHVFERVREHDLLLRKRVAPSELLTGCTFWVRHLSGEVLKVTSRRPLWDKTLQVLRGEGMPLQQDSARRGNLYVRFRCDHTLGASDEEALARLIPPVRDDGFMYEYGEPCTEAPLECEPGLIGEDLV